MTEDIKELIEAIKVLRHLLSQNGDYAISRKDNSGMGLGDQMIVGDATERVDKALKKVEQYEG